MKRGTIVYADLPIIANSHVQGGNRPAILVISENAAIGNPMVTIVPLTSKLSSTRFPNTLQFDPSPENGLTKTSVALVFQLCAIDRTRLTQTIGHLEEEQVQKIDEMIRKLLGL